MRKILSLIFFVLLSFSTVAFAEITDSDSAWESLPDIPHQTILNIAKSYKGLLDDGGDFDNEEMIENILRENLPERFTKIDVKINDDQFKVTMKYKLFWFFKIKVKIEGNIEVDYEEYTLNLKINKAKAFLFSIRSKLFEYLNTMDHPAIEVERPMIYISLFALLL